MSRSMQLNLPPALVQSTDTRASIAGPAEVKSLDVAEMLRDSVDASGCQQKEAAISAGYQPDYWTKALNGERGVQLDRLGLLPETVQREFVTRWARQLRMDVRTEDSRTRAIAELVECAAKALREIA